MSADDPGELVRLAEELDQALECIARNPRPGLEPAAAQALRRLTSGDDRATPDDSARRPLRKSRRRGGLTMALVTGGDASRRWQTDSDWAIGAELVKRSR